MLAPVLCFWQGGGEIHVETGPTATDQSGARRRVCVLCPIRQTALLLFTSSKKMPFNPSVQARESEKHGRGLFATADIPKGSPIWQFTESKECPKTQTGDSANKVPTFPSNGTRVQGTAPFAF